MVPDSVGTVDRLHPKPRVYGIRGYALPVSSSASGKLDQSRVAPTNGLPALDHHRRAIPRGPIAQLTDDK